MAATYNASHIAAGELASDIHRAQVVEATGKEDVAPIGHFEPGVKVDAASDDADGHRFPTDEEMKTLRRVPERVPWTAFWIAMCELSERFSYYGTVQVFQNFIQQPLPEGSTTGASPNGQAGALGRGQTAATGLTTLNTFWVYTTPLIGAYLADTYWGRFKTINIAVWIAIVGHIILIISAIPAVIDKPDASLGIFSVAIIIMGIGTGFFKSTVSPLIAEQVAGQRMSVQRLPSGEEVIVDPALTAGRIFNWFYAAINIGAVLGQVSMVYAEKYVGFWLSYTLPTIVFFLNVPILYFGRKKYIRTPPAGSVLAQALRVLRECLRGQWSWNPVTFMSRVSGPEFWEQAKPSRRAEGTVGPNGQVNGPMPAWMQRFDDAWVDEVSKGFKACYVFLLFPFYWISYNQISNNLVSQAANLRKNNVPNEIVSNLDPISIVILVPLFDLVIYPALRRAGINFTPLKRITAGFITVALGMVWAAVTQHYIYERSACGNMPSAQACLDATNGETDISVWTQVGAYVFVGLSEVFASVVGLEYAFTKAPKSMRSLVMSVFLFTNAIGSAINQAFLPLTVDPRQVALYGVLAGLSCAAGLLFFATTRSLDRDEDKMNNLAAGHISAKGILAEPQDAAHEHHKDLGVTEKH